MHAPPTPNTPPPRFADRLHVYWFEKIFSLVSNRRTSSFAETSADFAYRFVRCGQACLMEN